MSCSKRVDWYSDPVPGSGEKYFSNLSGRPLYRSASGGVSPFLMKFGHLPAYPALSASQGFKPRSLSATIASARHSGSQTPQSISRQSGCALEAPAPLKVIWGKRSQVMASWIFPVEIAWFSDMPRKDFWKGLDLPTVSNPILLLQ